MSVWWELRTFFRQVNSKHEEKRSHQMWIISTNYLCMQWDCWRHRQCKAAHLCTADPLPILAVHRWRNHVLLLLLLLLLLQAKFCSQRLSRMRISRGIRHTRRTKSACSFLKSIYLWKCNPVSRIIPGIVCVAAFIYLCNGCSDLKLPELMELFCAFIPQCRRAEPALPFTSAVVLYFRLFWVFIDTEVDLLWAEGAICFEFWCSSWNVRSRETFRGNTHVTFFLKFFTLREFHKSEFASSWGKFVFGKCFGMWRDVWQKWKHVCTGATPTSRLGSENGGPPSKLWLQTQGQLCSLLYLFKSPDPFLHSDVIWRVLTPT